MKNQRGMSFIGILVLVVLGVSITLLVVKLTPAYIEFFSVKKVMSAMAKDPAFATMSPAETRNSFDRRATIDYITTVSGKDLDISKDNGQNVASLEYAQKIPLLLNISACLDFSASTAKSSKPTKDE
jgi:hypothetical protein